MTLENCPMCHSAISHEGLVKACASCGADLSRWLPRPPKLQPAAQIVAAGPAAAASVQEAGDDSGRFNMGLGITGALAGAFLGSAFMLGCFFLIGLRFPLFGTGIGALTGYGARLLYKGTDHKLGVVSAVIGAVSVFGTLFLMYGEFPILNILTIFFAVSFAYRIAAR